MNDCIAFDLSLTNTGVAQFDSEFPHVISRSSIVSPKAFFGLHRIDFITTEVIAYCVEKRRLIAFEGLSFGSRDTNQERAGLAFCIRLELYRRGIAFLLVPPATLKKFVTGKGNAEKSIVIKEVYKRWGVECADDNQADAVGLLQLLRCYHGDLEPTTEAQRDVIRKLKGNQATGE